MTAKDRARIKIIEFIGNPENEFPNRRQIAKVACGYKDPHYLYKVFAVDELAQIEKEGLEIRRKHCWRQSAAVDQGLFKKAIAGDVAAIKLFYQRVEGWVEKKQHEFTDKNGHSQRIGTTQILNISESRLKEIINDLNNKV
jgi:hypothetical protein